ncbi:hypothetical protein [Streptomyces sp. NPDC017260]|uniref:hypothetical protein n=1 Tax=unclassified Streptomyces TaxID=2593676 RepID=UPI0037A0D40E
MKIGDMVRFTIEARDTGVIERHYAPILGWRKRNFNHYKGRPAKPYAAYLEPDHAGTQVLPLTELVPAAEDFEIITAHAEVHRGAVEWQNWYYKCRSCGPHTYKPARVKIVSKLTGHSVRVCDECHGPEELARLGHDDMWYGRRCKDSILQLQAHPELLTGPAGAPSDYYGQTEADHLRDWADSFGWLVPGPAAELYKQWKEQQTHEHAAA